jgi:hypothetical protein
MRRLVLIAASLLALLALAQPAAAATAPKSHGVTISDVGASFYPVAPNVTPPGFTVDGAQALAVAKTDPEMVRIHRAHHPLQYSLLVWPAVHYEIEFSYHGKLIAAQVVTKDGHLGPTYTGGLIIGVYARGHYGAIFDSMWVWLPLGLMFLFPLAFMRRRSWLDVVDLAMVLTFGVSYALFDHEHLDLAVWLFYPPLLYLMVRMLWRGMRPRKGAARIDCRLPIAVLATGLLALIAGRIWLALHEPYVMDVAEASVVGAFRILHGASIYYPNVGHGDTYGPITYLAYAPFQLIWPGDNWASYVPSARAATITFDLLTIAGLVWLGKRLRPGSGGWKLGLLMGWLWAACPFTAMGLVKDTNDGLVAMLLVALMLSLTAPIRRGALVGLAAAAKFFPAILLPLILVGKGGADRRNWRKTAVGFVVAAAGPVALLLPPGGLGYMWDRTLGFQLTRSDIFSAWALHPSLGPLKVAVEIGVVLLAIVVVFRPRGTRTTAQVAALTAGLIVAIQLPALHWFYLYIPWFMPVVLIAVLTAGEEPHEGQVAVADRPEDALFEHEDQPAAVAVAA